jgi:hypothetical protein
VQINENPRWKVDRPSTIVIRECPQIFNSHVPPVVENATLATVQPLSNNERSVKQQEIAVFKTRITNLHQILSSKQNVIQAAYPRYKRIGHVLLLIVATLSTITALLLSIYLIYRVLRFFVDLYSLLSRPKK